jgi:predicted nucleic acid-binding protein
LILLDTNVFLEVLLRRKDAVKCKELLDRLSRGELEGVVTHFTIHSIEALIGKHQGDTVSFLRAVEQTSGLFVYDTTVADEVAVSLLSEKIGRDFDDALQYYVAKKLGANTIVSYDRHFDGLDIPRSEPAGVR